MQLQTTPPCSSDWSPPPVIKVGGGVACKKQQSVSVQCTSAGRATERDGLLAPRHVRVHVE